MFLYDDDLMYKVPGSVCVCVCSYINSVKRFFLNKKKKDYVNVL